MTSGKRWPRLLARLASFSIFAGLLWPAMPSIRAPSIVTQSSPFIVFASSLASREFGVGSMVGFSIAALALARRRWFCRYACPTGLLLEGAAKIGLKRTAWWAAVPDIGKYVALATFMGAFIGYPALLWTDPLAIFSSAFSIRFKAISGVLTGFGLAVLIILGLTSGGLWCARLCPLGGTQEMLASIKEWIEKARGFPHVGTQSSLAVAGRTRIARRIFLAGAAGIGIGLWARRIGERRRSSALLRPPGAVSEDRFTGLCIRCGNCIRACPSKIILPDTGRAGLAGLLAPVIRYRGGYCLEDCSACTQVCPSGTLKSLNLEQKAKYVIGEALMDVSLCLLALGQKDCDACVRACPFDAVRIHWDEDSYIAYPIVDKKRCNGCGACELVCPPEENKAITVRRV